MGLTEARPAIAVTMGDVAGIGPEVIAKGLRALREVCRPIVIGNPDVLARAFQLVGRNDSEVRSVDRPEFPEDGVACLDPSEVEVRSVEPGRIDAAAGRAAYDYLVAAIDLAMRREIDAIVTLPLNKEALRLGGVSHPGHTEILAERCGATNHAMMLYLGPPHGGASGLGVIHATLHVPLREVFELLTTDLVRKKIELADEALRPITNGRRPRIAVAGLNPHAGENGLFGVEERQIIRPAVELALKAGFLAEGPIAADTLFQRAVSGEFDAVVAMYHDQGHVALKTIGFDRAVNVTLGLPIVRSSVAHGTAFDIAWKGVADPSSLIEATRVAVRIVNGKRLLGLEKNVI